MQHAAVSQDENMATSGYDSAGLLPALRRLTAIIGISVLLAIAGGCGVQSQEDGSSASDANTSTNVNDNGEPSPDEPSPGERPPGKPPSGEPVQIDDVDWTGEGVVTQQANGSLITFTATPNQGWEFEGWTKPELADPSENPITVDFNEDAVIRARFVEVDTDPGPADSDGDGVADEADNCVAVANGNQADSDGDGVGDVCDNCPGNANEDQADFDGDGVGDVCEEDQDGDGVPDEDDNCPTASNPGQADTDGDGWGDPCDNCPELGNIDQTDTDADGLGDACDACPNDADNDADQDEVCGDVDQCSDTPVGAKVDAATGCPVDDGGGNGGGGNGGGGPVCGDGVVEGDEQCDPPNGTTCDGDCQTIGGTAPVCGDDIEDPGEECDDGGESAACDPDCTFAECGDDTLNTTAGEQCDDGNVVPDDGCDANCRSELCGNGTLDPGEECDDGNTVSGDGCNANCRNEADSCANATAIAGEGPFDFDNTTATRDGPPHANCLFAIEDQMDNDVWMCWTSPCTATVFVDTCRQTAIDTEIAVYEGCGCPATDGRLAACNDDVCDECAACGYQSVVAFEAVSGQSYLIRMGTYPGKPSGVGTMSIRCEAPDCPGVGECFTDNGTPGCDDEGCCDLTCSVDPFCCYVGWDGQCAARGSFECTGSFSACEEGAGDCMAANGTAGCDNADCCNTVCDVDILCCADEWDDVCACKASGFCTGSFDACAAGSGNCSVDNSTPGCDDVACCNTVCTADPFCCCDTWDATCADEAADMCSP